MKSYQTITDYHFMHPEDENKARHLASLLAPSFDSFCFPLVPEFPLEVRPISSEVGHGVFCLESIEKGSYLGAYLGLLEPMRFPYSSSDYLHSYPTWEKERWTIDAGDFGCITRFYNHSFTPTLEKKWIYNGNFLYLLFIAKEKLEKGTQMTFNYGAGYWLIRQTPVNL